MTFGFLDLPERKADTLLIRTPRLVYIYINYTEREKERERERESKRQGEIMRESHDSPYSKVFLNRLTMGPTLNGPFREVVGLGS